MTRQEYVHIRNLAWDLLIDAKISELPVDISRIAGLYNIEYNHDADFYDKALEVSKEILSIFGYKTEPEYVEALTVRLLAPSIVLNQIDVKSAGDISEKTGLPIDIAQSRFERYKVLVERNKFGLSKMEMRVLNQFMRYDSNR